MGPLFFSLLERWSTLPNCGLHDRRFRRVCADMATAKSLGVAYTPHPHSLKACPGRPSSMATREPSSLLAVRDSSRRNQFGSEPCSVTV